MMKLVLDKSLQLGEAFMGTGKDTGSDVAKVIKGLLRRWG